MTGSVAAGLVGRLAGEYELVEHVGNGQFGLVYRGVHNRTGAVVAIKVLSLTRMGDAQAAQEFHNEGELLKKLLNRSHVINWIESDTANIPMSFVGSAGPVPIPIPYHALAWASGDLDEIVADPTALAAVPWIERLEQWRGAVLGVHQMHLSGVSHRDLKGANCLLMVGARNGVEVRVADLGRSKDFSKAAILPTNAYLIGRGDPSHAAPEFLRLQGGHRGRDFCLADLYGLGSILAELATGQPMTALAVGNWRGVLEDAEQDLKAGVARDLSTFRPQYMLGCQEAAEQAPRVVRIEVERLLRQLCSPVPDERLQVFRGRQVSATDGLDWLLRRADILIGRLRVEGRRASHKRGKKGA